MILTPDEGIQSWVSGDLPKSPYPGLRPFDLDEWQIFFGREAITDELIGLLISQHVVSVHGSSGSGKSSLIRAGVMPRLEQDHAANGLTWQNCTMVPGNSPLENLAKAFVEEGLDPSKRAERIIEIRRILNRGREAAPELCRELRRGPQDHLCILIDQFEELFRFANTNRAEALLFVEILVGLAENPPEGLYAILTMRSDYLGDCARFPDLARTVNRTQYLLPRMNRADLLRAVREPAELYGGWVNADLAERLIADASAEQDELPLIQHGLMILWRDGPALEEGSEGRELKLSDYIARNGLGPILSDHADGVVAEAAPDEARRKVVEQLFRALTDTNADRNGIRRSQRFSDLCAVTGASAEGLGEIIDHFRTEGVSFLRPYQPDAIGPNTEVDISHEALIRCWHKVADRKDGWLQREFRDGLIWRALLVAADSYEADPTNVLGPTATDDRDRWLANRNEAWARRYGNEWARVQHLMEASREARDRLRKDQEERARVLMEAQKARTEAAETKAAQAASGRRLAFVVTTVAMLIALGMGIYAFRSSAERDRLNRELAGTLWTQLEFKENDLLPAEISALWDLTLAEDAVHRLFWSRLDSPDEANERNERLRKLSARPEHLTRTTGLESDRASFAINALLTLLKETRDVRQIAILTRAVRPLSSHLAPDQVAAVMDANLVGLRNANEDDLRIFADNFVVLTRGITASQARVGYNAAIDILRTSVSADKLGAGVKILLALAPRIGPDDIDSAMQIALNHILIGIEYNSSPAQKIALIGTLETLLPSLSSPQVASLSGGFVTALKSTSQETVLERALQLWDGAGASKKVAETTQARTSLLLTLHGIRASIDPKYLQMFVAKLVSLVPRVEQSEIQSVLADMLRLLASTTDPDQLQAVFESLKSIAGIISPTQVDEALKGIVRVLETSTDPDQLPASAMLLGVMEPKLSADQIQATVESMLARLGKSRDTDQLNAYQDVLLSLAPRQTAQHFDQVIDVIFQSLERDGGLDRSVVLIGIVSALKIDPTPAQLNVLLAALLQGLRTSVDPDQLGTFVAALLNRVPKLSSAQINETFESVLQGFSTATDYDQLPALMQVFEGIVARLSPEQLEIARERITKDIGLSANLYQLKELINAANVLEIKLPAEQVRGPLDFALRNLRPMQGASLSASQTSAISDLLRSLSRHMTPDHFNVAVLTISAELGRVRANASQSAPFASAIRALAPGLTPAQVSDIANRIIAPVSPFAPQALSFIDTLPPPHTRAVIESILRGLDTGTNTNRRSALVETLSSIAKKIAPVDFDFIIRNTHGRIDGASTRSRLSSFVDEFGKFVPQLAQHDVDRVFYSSLANKSENLDQAFAHIDVFRVLAPRLTLDQVPLAFERVLKASRPDTSAERSKTIVAALDAILDSAKEKAGKASLEETSLALDKLLNSLNDFDRERSRTNVEQGKVTISALEGLVDVAGVFGSSVEPTHMPSSFGILLGILGRGGNNVSLARSMQSLEGFMPRLGDEQATLLSRISRARLALAVGPEEGAAWARLVNVELNRRSEQVHLRDVIEILQYPGAVGDPTAVLLKGVHDRFKLPHQGESTLRDLSSLIKSRFPELRRDLRSVPRNPNARSASARSAP